MKLKQLTRIGSLLFLIISLVAGSFQVPVQALTEKKETIAVIGDEKAGILLPETTVTYQENVTAFELLLKTVGESNLEYSESSYGKMITGIKGLKAIGNYYWAFYVNGVSSQIGADQYKVQKEDRISFHYVDWSIASDKAVSLKVVGSNGTMKEVENIALKGEPTAFHLLQVVYGDQLGFAESQYGKMITSIADLKAEGTYYWAFYVNGQMAPLGADSYVLKNTDQISFQYESWEKPSEDSNEEETDKETNVDTGKPNMAIPTNELKKSIDLASQYVLKNQVSEWEAVALKQAGKTIPESYLENVMKQIEDRKGKFSKITDYERYVLGILAANGNPTNLAGYNLVKAIYNGDITKQGLNGVFYALIALDSGEFKIPTNAKWTRDKLVNYLLEKQNKDHGWAWDGSSKSDSDTTAMVLTALSSYKEKVEVEKAINLGVEFLKSQYQSGKIDNSSTASQMIVGLSANGIDSNSPLFTRDGQSLISYLLTFQNHDGGFDWQGGNVSDVMSTSQGIQGIVAYQLFVTEKGKLFQLPLALENTNVDKSENPDSAIQEEDSSQDGLPLPNTATNTYNYLLFGILLMIIGVSFYMIEKRKKA